MSWRSAGLNSIQVGDFVEDIVGIAALVLSLVYRIPQIYAIYKSKKANDISACMILIQNLSYVLYISYGVFVHDWIYILSSVVSLVQNLFILYLKNRYAAHDECSQ